MKAERISGNDATRVSEFGGDAKERFGGDARLPRTGWHRRRPKVSEETPVETEGSGLFQMHSEAQCLGKSHRSLKPPPCRRARGWDLPGKP